MKVLFKWLILNLIIATTTFCLNSCGGGDKKDSGSGSSVSLTLSLNSLSFNANGASNSLQIISSANWTSSASDKDIKVNPSSGGKGTTSVTITLPENTTKQSKTYSVTFSSGKSTKILSITQAGKGSSYAPVTLSASEITIAAANGSTGTFDILCNGDWVISTSNKPEWITNISATEGSGNTTIKVTTSANTEKVLKNYILSISSGSNNASIVVNKAAAENHAPTKPTNLSPTGSNVLRNPTFSWSASTDADNDQVKYTVKYSKDNSSWSSLESTTSTTIYCSTSLDANTTYYWKVVADDNYVNGKTESDVVSFTTNSTKTSYDDCEVKVYQTGTVAKPVVLIFTGDGYTPDLFNYGGQFDQEVDAQIEALFDIEPYKTYRHYFTVYKIAAYSNEAGISQGDDFEHRTTAVDTRFKCTWEGGGSTGIDCDVDEVLEVVQNVPGIKGSSEMQTIYNLTWSPISITINANVYAGTNLWWGLDNQGIANNNFGVLSVAQTPARHPSSGSYSGSAYTLRHEFGGHGFGLLDDEYVYYTSQTIPTEYKNDILEWKEYGLIGCNGNVTFEVQKNGGKYEAKNSCEWYQFIGRPEFTAAAIGVYEGAYMYGKGIWRSEYISCMNDNRPHFNTQSRWQIYRRIKITAGETPTLEDFIANDNDKVQSFTITKGLNTKPLTPPTLIRNGRKIKAYGKKR